MSKKNTMNESFESAVELTQKSANVALKSAVQTAEITENYVQGLYKAGYNANIDALRVAEGYWTATSQIRQDWIKLFAATGEAFINSAAKMELPLQKEVMEISKTVASNVEKTFESLTAQAKAATK
jgi:hypothetical protein